MIDIRAVQGHTIALGRLGENNYTRILFDVSEWLAEYPQATIGLLNVRPGETIAYPVSPGNLSLDNGILYWIVTNSDLSAKGTGRCELVAYHGNTIMKSAIFKTMCLEALDGGATPPEPWESWQSFFQALADNAAQSASDAEAAVEHYPRIVDGVWEVWDAQEGAFVSTGVQALGVDGVSPTITVDTITGGHRITITDANGTHTVDILDGAKGDTGRGIVSVQKTGTAGLVDTYTITYTDNTTSTFTVTNGQPGQDGISPSITITDITGGHRVTITDANGTRSFDVMDGEDYVLTAADKAEIAQQAAAEVDVPTVATASQVKAGTDSEHFLAPSVQDNAVFYALAKAAGADMASSSNPVGTYTDAAKVAIQKMLGIYEAPWELIREDTFTNATEADHIITVDGNGEAFELTDVVLLFELPNVDAPASKGYYGHFRYYYTENDYVVLEAGPFSRTATDNAKGTSQLIIQENGMCFAIRSAPGSGSNSVNLTIRNYASTSTTKSGFFYVGNTPIYFNRINIMSVTGTGAYKLYGKRKWQ